MSSQNAGLDSRRGRFIAFADNDDILDRHNIEYLLHALLSTGASMSKARWRQFGLSQRDEVARLAQAGAKDPSTVTVFHDPLRAYQTVFCKSLRLLGQACGRRTEARYFNEANWCRLYRRNVWDGIRFPDGVYAQDVMVAGLLYERMDTVVDIDVVLYHWLQSPESVTHAQRGFDFYHDNVDAGVKNFSLALGHGIIPMRSYYTMVGALTEERSSPDFAQNAARHDEDRSVVGSLVHKLSIAARTTCSIKRLIRLAEKDVYDRKVKNLR